MKRQSVAIASTFLLSAVIMGAFLLRAPAPAASAPALGPDATRALSFSLAPGRTLVHRVVIEQTSEVSAFGSKGGPMHGKTALDVELQLDGLAQDPDGTLAALQLTRVHAADVTVQDEPLLDSIARGALVGPRATVRIATNGRVTGLNVPVGAPPMFTRLLQLMLAETQMTFGSGTTWTAEEQTAAMSVVVRYTRSDEGVATDLTRTAQPSAIRFPGVTVGTHDVRVDGGRTARVIEGRIHSLVGDESLVVKDNAGIVLVDQRTTVDVQLLSEGTANTPVPTTEQLVAVDPHVIQRDDAAAQEQALAARVDGLSRQELLADLTGALPTGSVPGHERFLWRASGLLQQEPALVASLAPLFSDPRASHEGRALILDLLVGARHGTAQALLCQLLETPAVQEDPKAILLRQRLSFVRHPTAETLAFVKQKATSATAFRDPARMSLGSMAGALARTDRSEEAIAAAQMLVSLHDAASTDAERGVLVRALGNAGLDGFDGPLLSAARSTDRDARAAAASGLRKMRSDRAREALFALVRDPEATVSRRAIDSLGERPFDPSISAAVLAALAARDVQDAAYQAVVSLLARHARTDADARAALELILTQDVNDKQVKGRVRQILRSLGA